jgi:hypothetical protein
MAAPVLELLSSEISYNTSLKCCQLAYHKPLRTLQDSLTAILTKNEIDEIFCNVHDYCSELNQSATR